MSCDTTAGWAHVYNLASLYTTLDSAPSTPVAPRLEWAGNGLSRGDAGCRSTVRDPTSSTLRGGNPRRRCSWRGSPAAAPRPAPFRASRPAAPGVRATGRPSVVTIAVVSARAPAGAGPAPNGSTWSTAAITLAGSATSGGRMTSSFGPKTRQIAATPARYCARVGSELECAVVTRTTAVATPATTTAHTAPTRARRPLTARMTRILVDGARHVQLVDARAGAESLRRASSPAVKARVGARW